MEPQAFVLLWRELKHRVFGKAVDIPSHGLIEDFCFNTIELGQIGIQYYLLRANQQDAARSVRTESPGLRSQFVTSSFRSSKR
jgi:hypothetical protein